MEVSEDKELKEKGEIIDKIIFACKVSNVSNNKEIPLDNVFIELLACDISELKNIALNLGITL